MTHPRKVLTELWSEDLEVRLHGLLHEPLGRVADLDRLHVQLVFHNLRQLRRALERTTVAVIRIEYHDELGERRARLHARRRTRRTTKLDDAASRPHPPLEVVIDALRAFVRIRGEVDRRLGARRARTNKALIHILAQEGHVVAHDEGREYRCQHELSDEHADQEPHGFAHCRGQGRLHSWPRRGTRTG